MIYLIKSVGLINADLGISIDNLRLVLKIGYTEDLRSEVRFAAYTTHNIVYEIIDSIKGGSLLLESALHKKFKRFQINNEWFEYTDDIIDFFKNNHSEEALILSLKDECEEKFQKLQKDKLRALLGGDIELILLLSFVCSRISALKNLKISAAVVELFNNGVYEKDEIIKYYLSKYNLSSESFIEFKDSINEDTMNTLISFNNIGFFTEKMKFLCSNLNILELAPIEFQTYINVIGVQKIKAVSYQEADLKRLISFIQKTDTVSENIYSQFNIGSSYTLKDIKQYLKNLYERLGISGNYMASELEKYFEVKKCKVKTDNGRDNGLLIIKKKEE